MSDQLYDEWDAACNKVRELEAEAEINHRLISRQSDLLTGVANALRGEPDELSTHSHHDLPERARAVVGELAELREENKSLEYQLWSLCDSEGIEWYGDIPTDPDAPIKQESSDGDI